MVKSHAKTHETVRYSYPMNLDPFHSPEPPKRLSADHVPRQEQLKSPRRRHTSYSSRAPRGFWARRWENAFRLGFFLVPLYILLTSSDAPYRYIAAGAWAGLLALSWLTLRAIRLRLHHRLRDHLASIISRVRDRI